MSERQALIESWQREIPITLKVLKVFPANQAGFQPHEKSQSAIKLSWIFVLSQMAIQSLLDGTFSFPPNLPPPPERWSDLIAAFESESSKHLEKMKAAEDSDLKQTVMVPDPYAGRPGEMKDISKSFFMWFLLSDHIHHRGQLSVYLRLAGGKVPSIYGPSADEPWR